MTLVEIADVLTQGPNLNWPISFGLFDQQQHNTRTNGISTSFRDLRQQDQLQ